MIATCAAVGNAASTQFSIGGVGFETSRPLGLRVVKSRDHATAAAALEPVKTKPTHTAARTCGRHRTLRRTSVITTAPAATTPGCIQSWRTPTGLSG